MRKAFDEEWERIHSCQEWGQYPCEAVIRFVARNYYKFSERHLVRVLDFGCGGGAHTWFLAREGFDVYAFDGSESAVEKVRVRLDKERLSANLSVQDAVSINYQASYFDAVIDNFCIYANKLVDIRTMYTNVYKILKKGGKVFTSSFSAKTSGYGTGEKVEENTFRNLTEGNIAGRGTVHFWEENEIFRMLSDVGFLDIIIEPMEYIDKGNLVSIFNVVATK